MIIQFSMYVCTGLIVLIVNLLQTMGGLLPGSMNYAPPEVKKSGWSSLKE